MYKNYEYLDEFTYVKKLTLFIFCFSKLLLFVIPTSDEEIHVKGLMFCYCDLFFFSFGFIMSMISFLVYFFLFVFSFVVRFLLFSGSNFVVDHFVESLKDVNFMMFFSFVDFGKKLKIGLIWWRTKSARKIWK